MFIIIKQMRLHLPSLNEPFSRCFIGHVVYTVVFRGLTIVLIVCQFTRLGWPRTDGALYWQ